MNPKLQQFYKTKFTEFSVELHIDDVKQKITENTFFSSDDGIHNLGWRTRKAFVGMEIENGFYLYKNSRWSDKRGINQIKIELTDLGENTSIKLSSGLIRNQFNFILLMFFGLTVLILYISTKSRGIENIAPKSLIASIIFLLMIFGFMYLGSIFSHNRIVSKIKALCHPRS